MAPTINRFQFDDSAVDRDNFVPGEIHSIGTNVRRVIVPKYGAFYAKSVELLDAFTQKPLEHNVHYIFDSLRVDPSELTGKAIYGLIVVIDPNVSDIIELNYQAVGGPYANHAQDALRMAQILKNDTRTVSVGSISDVPDAFVPSKHFQSLASLTNFDGLAHDVDRLRMLHNLRSRLDGDVIYGYVENQLTDLSQDGATQMADLMAAHLADPQAHPQYVLKTEIDKYILPIRKPINRVPGAGQVDVNLDVTLSASPYLSLYRIPQATAQFQVSQAPDFSGTPVLDVTLGAVSSFHYNDVLGSNKLYYWRMRYADTNGAVSEWTAPTAFTTKAVSVTQPTFLAPTGGTSSNTETPTLTASAFAIVGDTDTHLSSDWEVWDGPNGTGNLIWSKVGDTVNKTAITMPLAVLTRLSTYYPRVRYKATKYGYSAWTTGASFYAIWQLRPTVIGQLFQGGYWGGDIVLADGATYAIVVAPKAIGEKQLKLVGNLVNTPGSSDALDSVKNTNSLATLTGTSASAAAAFVKGLSIAGYSDWVIPAKNVAAQIATKLAGNGASTPAPFKAGGAEVWQSAYYWTSTTYDWTDSGSYTTGGDPIYGTKTRGITEFGPSCDNQYCPSPSEMYLGIADWSSNGVCRQGTPNANGFVVCSWTCIGTTTAVVGYTPTETHYYSDPQYSAWMYYPATSGSTYSNKTSNYWVRAVRLVKVSG